MRQTNLDEFLKLEEKNRLLEEQVKKEVDKNKKKDQLLFSQNKLATLGEMLGNIAHQWRQPLMEINTVFWPIQTKMSMNMPISNEELNETIKKVNDITSYMSQTIEDFRNYFREEKQKVEFKVLEQINSTINIINSGLKKNNIKLDVIINKNPTLVSYKNDYSQVLINIINNAIDELVARKIENPYIKISISEQDNNLITTVEDNAGGIEVNPINKIFEPFYTYKKKNGSGIGLFMSKLIVENNFNGTISAQNIDNGAKFTITIPKQ